MDEIEIDRILSSEPQIQPSPAFAGRVLDAVRREAAAPPPIPFPWGRLVPALVSFAVIAAVSIVQTDWSALLTDLLEFAPRSLASEAIPLRTAAVLLALGVSYLVPQLSRRLITR